MFMMAYSIFLDESRVQQRVPSGLADIVPELGIHLTCRLLFVVYFISS